MVLLAVIAVVIIIYNKSDDERNVYTAFFTQYESSFNMKDVAFLSTVSTCGIEASNTYEAEKSLIQGFKLANNSTAKPANISIYSSMVNVVKWNATNELHGMSHTTSHGKYTIVSLSRIGFNKEKNEALICVETPHSTFVSLFKKENTNNWAYYKNIIGTVE